MGKPKPIKIKKCGISKYGKPYKKQRQPLRLDVVYSRPDIGYYVTEHDNPTVPITGPDESTSSRPSAGVRTCRTHAENMKRTVKSWSLLSNHAVPMVLGGAAFSGQTICDICDQEYDCIARLPSRCYDCLQFNTCNQCMVDMHKYVPFHITEVWNEVDFKFEPLEYSRSIKNTKRTPCIKAGPPMKAAMDIVTHSGRVLNCQVEFQHCECHPLPVQLTELGLWPGTPSQPSFAYSFEFLKLVQYMMLEGHMSLQASCQTFMWTHGWTASQCKKIYRQLSNECFEEFRHFLFRVESDEKPVAECPACLKDGPVFYSLDGNFGLVRKKNSGESHNPPKHHDRFFLNESEVSDFVEARNNDKDDTAEECSTFKAGDLVRSKNKAHGLDQTGVFGCICRHGIPKLFLSMKYGERFAYPIFLLMKLLSRTSDDAKPIIIYDIACKLHKHLQKSSDEMIRCILDRVDFAVPCWHAYGHGKDCQIKYSTNWKEGCGITDGEEMERLWSYLRKFSHISKEMTPSHRIDLLSDALIHFSKRKTVDMALALVLRANKARQIEKSALEQLQDLIQETNKEGFDRQCVEEWCVELQDNQSQTRQRQDRVQVEWQEKYVNTICKVDNLKTEMKACRDPERTVILNKQIEIVENNLLTYESQHKLSHRWTADHVEYQKYLTLVEDKKRVVIVNKMKNVVDELSFHRSLRAKYSDGQQQANRIAKQIRKSGCNLQKLVNTYNASNFTTNGKFPANLSYNEVNSSEADVFMRLEAGDSDLIVSPGIRREAIQLANKIKRASEEHTQSVAEMTAYCSHLEADITAMNLKLSQFDTSIQLDRGQKVLTLQHVEQVSCKLKEARQLFDSYVIQGEEPEGDPLYDFDTYDTEVEEEMF